MRYSPISLNSCEVPSCVTELVARQVDPLLRDIFCMLEHPRYNPDAEPGFNLSAASILFGIIAGLSRVFCNEITEDKAAFLRVLEYYPIGGPDNSIDINEFASELYGIYRCNLVHALGLNTGRPNREARWQIESLPEEKKVTRHSNLPLSVYKLVELNDQTVRPDWLRQRLPEPMAW